MIFHRNLKILISEALLPECAFHILPLSVIAQCCPFVSGLLYLIVRMREKPAQSFLLCRPGRMRAPDFDADQNQRLSHFLPLEIQPELGKDMIRQIVADRHIDRDADRKCEKWLPPD